MIKKLIILAMACFILTGSVVFPLGDFSLTRDLPEMYRNYSKIATPEDFGVIDFIGDYLLHGKEIFGHNAHDKPQNASNSVQFQHQPFPFFVIVNSVQLRIPVIINDIIVHAPPHVASNTSDFKNKLFRPPLA